MSNLKDVNKDNYMRALFTELHGQKKAVNMDANAADIRTIVCTNNHEGLLTTMDIDTSRAVASRYSKNGRRATICVDGDYVTPRNTVILERIDNPFNTKFAHLNNK